MRAASGSLTVPQIVNPGSYEISRVVRSDGTVLPQGNAWLTVKIERAQSRRLLQDTTVAFLHILDSGASSNYTTSFQPSDNCTCYPGVDCLPNATDPSEFFCGSCPVGRVGDGEICENYNPCILAPCAPGVICTDEAPPSLDFSCGPCKASWRCA